MQYTPKHKSWSPSGSSGYRDPGCEKRHGTRHARTAIGCWVQRHAWGSPLDTYTPHTLLHVLDQSDSIYNRWSVRQGRGSGNSPRCMPGRARILTWPSEQISTSHIAKSISSFLLTLETVPDRLFAQPWVHLRVVCCSYTYTVTAWVTCGLVFHLLTSYWKNWERQMANWPIWGKSLGLTQRSKSG